MSSFYQNNGAAYRQFFYDSNGSVFYVASFYMPRIDIFNLTCSFIRSIDIGGNQLFGLSYFNGKLSAGTYGSNKFYFLTNGLITNTFILKQCSVTPWQSISLTFDSFGNLAVSCLSDNLILIYDFNGKYLTSMSTSDLPFTTGIDSAGRFIVMNRYSLDIYY